MPVILFISIENAIRNQLCDGLCDILPLMKYKGLCYPRHFLKIGGSGIMNNFLKYRPRQVSILAQRNVFIHYSLQINYI